MKNLIFSLFIVLVYSTNVFSYYPDVELLIYNYTGINTIYIKLYPFGSLFDGYNNANPVPTRYTLNNRFYNPTSPILYPGIQRKGGGPRILHIVGLDGYALNKDINHPGYFAISNNSACEFGHDCSGAGMPDGEIGYGKYILKIFHEVDNILKPICDSILIDWMDFNYGKANFSNQAADLLIYVKDTSSSGILYHWDSVSPVDEKHVFDSSATPGILQVWRQYQHYNQITHQWEGFNVPSIIHPPDLGSSISDSNFTIYPLDGRKLEHPYTLYNHNSSGDLFGNLTINQSISTRDTLIDSITNIIVPTHGFLNINQGKSFEMITPVSPSNGSNNLIIQDSSLLLLSTNSQLIVSNKNKVTLKKKGVITLYSGSIIKFMNGSSFCNLGGRIFGPGRIEYQYGSHILCREIVDNYFSDSVKMVLEDNATLEIPDSTVLHFTGSQSGLIMNPNSKLKMGEGSKILFDSGASIFANGATFTSLDSTLKWDGIVLNNSDADTITNCTFSNAVTPSVVYFI